MRPIKIIRRIVVWTALVFGIWALIHEQLWVELVMVGFGLLLFTLLDLAKWES